jgi:hypothetical protein
MSYFIGLSGARAKTTYEVLAKDPSWVIVRFMDDKAVLAERHEDALTGRIKIINISGDEASSPDFFLLQTGKLTQVKPATGI